MRKYKDIFQQSFSTFSVHDHDEDGRRFDLNDGVKNYAECLGLYITQQLIDSASMFAPWIRLRDEMKSENVVLNKPWSNVRAAIQDEWKGLDMEMLAISPASERFWAIRGWHQFNLNDEITKKWLRELLVCEGTVAEKTALLDLKARYWLFEKERMLYKLKDNLSSESFETKLFFSKKFVRFCGIFSIWLETVCSDDMTQRISSDAIDSIQVASQIYLTQITPRYHPVVSKCKRWLFISNTRRVYTDLLFFDNCLPFYDWWPHEDPARRWFSMSSQILGWAAEFAQTAISSFHGEIYRPEQLAYRYSLLFPLYPTPNDKQEK